MTTGIICLILADLANVMCCQTELPKTRLYVAVKYSIYNSPQINKTETFVTVNRNHMYYDKTMKKWWTSAGSGGTHYATPETVRLVLVARKFCQRHLLL